MSQTGPSSSDPTQKRNAKVAVICAVTFLAMVGAAYAAVPLYKAFCQATGFDGTVRQAVTAPDKVLDRKILIRFDTNVRDLPWTFKADQASQTLKIGETGLAYFEVTNTGDKDYTGRASYGVIPETVGPYFQKLQCFCFSDQTIPAGKTVKFPVLYFIDPKFVDDFESRGKQEVTLSYTFYPAPDAPQTRTAEKTIPAKASQVLGGTPKAGL